MPGGKLLLVAGYPASGKSTFARALSGRLRVPAFRKDALNETFADRMPIPSLDVRKGLSVASLHVLLLVADEMLRAGRSVILESNFKPQEAPFVRDLVERHSCEVLTFLFLGDLAALYGRFAARERTPDRHPIHKYHGLADADAFARAARPLAEFRAPGRIIAVDATDFAGVDYECLVREAENFLYDGA